MDLWSIAKRTKFRVRKCCFRGSYSDVRTRKRKRKQTSRKWPFQRLFTVVKAHLIFPQESLCAHDLLVLSSVCRRWRTEFLQYPYKPRQCWPDEQGLRYATILNVSGGYVYQTPTPLECAAYHGHMSRLRSLCTDELVERLYFPDWYYNTPMILTVVGQEIDDETKSILEKRKVWMQKQDGLSWPMQTLGRKCCEAAASGKQLGCLRFLHEQCHFRTDTADSAAARSGSLECFQYALEKTPPHIRLPSNNLIEIAAEAGNVNILRCLHEKYPISISSNVPKYAAKGGSLECLEFLLSDEVGCVNTAKVCRYAAAEGHLVCLRFALENGCPSDEITCQWAVENNELDCLICAHEHNCPWSSRTCRSAAAGSLQCLQYLHENQCPWDGQTVAAAWGCKCPNRLPHPYTYSCMVWEMDFSTDGPKVFTEADAKDALYPECFRYAVRNGCPIPHADWE